MKKHNALQVEIDSLIIEKKSIKNRLEKATDESAKIFLQNLLNYTEENLSALIDKQKNELNK